MRLPRLRSGTLPVPFPTALPMPARVVVVLGALHLVDRAVAWACSCASIDDPVAAMDDYEQVFVGRVQGTAMGCGGQQEATTRFEVTEAFKGVEVGEIIAIDHGTQGASCGLTFDRGGAYLIYAIDDATSLCAPGGAAMEEAGTLDDLRAATGG